MDKKKKLIIIIAAAVVLIGLGSFGAIEYTSQVGFCNSCHEMNPAFAGWEGGTHQNLHCYECHTDPGLINKAKVKMNGMKEVYIHLTQDVNMEEVVADIPASRCIKCHDMTDKEKYDARVVNNHASHKGFGFEDCMTCHRPVGHTGNSFDGFKNADCTKCHAAPAKNTTEQPTKTTEEPKKPDSTSTSTQPSTSGSTSGSTSTSTSSSTSTSTSTSTSKPALNLGHDLGATYVNGCATCHAGSAMLAKKPSHSIDGSTVNCSTCHTLKPKT